MKILQILTLVSLTIFFSFSCDTATKSVDAESNQSEQGTAVANDVSVNEFKSLINDNSIVLDVRRPVEFKAGHLKNAININYFDDDFLAQVIKLDKSKTLLIHCASGGRSAGAMSKLSGRGFEAMYNMLGGINAWENAKFEVVK
ncbi:MAG: rhodanese-like domain-containing protein [Flavobacteriales bacterium]